MFLGTVGAICIIVGLFTRFFAAALAIELGIAFLVVHMSKGFAAAHFSCSLSQYAAAVPIRLTAQSARNFRPPKHSVSPSRSRF
jgi:uncharacterized membrane protein YphA (DoxX/SURF4 family)